MPEPSPQAQADRLARERDAQIKQLTEDRERLNTAVNRQLETIELQRTSVREHVDTIENQRSEIEMQQGKLRDHDGQVRQLQATIRGQASSLDRQYETIETFRTEVRDLRDTIAMQQETVEALVTQRDADREHLASAHDMIETLRGQGFAVAGLNPADVVAGLRKAFEQLGPAVNEMIARTTGADKPAARTQRAAETAATEGTWYEHLQAEGLRLDDVVRDLRAEDVLSLPPCTSIRVSHLDGRPVEELGGAAKLASDTFGFSHWHPWDGEQLHVLRVCAMHNARFEAKLAA